jgi:hypothetical protein
MEKTKFRVAPESYLALGLLFKEGIAPDLYLIPSKVWQRPQAPFVSREYSGKKSKPEWGINLQSKTNILKLEPFRFENTVKEIINSAG